MRAGLVAVLVTSAVALAACGGNTVYRTPSTIGVIREVNASGSAVHFVLADGHELTLAASDTLDPAHYPTAADLLLSGSDPKPWWLVAYIVVPGGCYQIPGAGYSRPSEVDMDVGVRFLKAPGFESVGGGERLQGRLGSLCIDTRGNALSYNAG